MQTISVNKLDIYCVAFAFHVSLNSINGFSFSFRFIFAFHFCWFFRFHSFYFSVNRKSTTIHHVAVFPLSLKRAKWPHRIYWFNEPKYRIPESTHVNRLMRIRAQWMFMCLTVRIQILWQSANKRIDTKKKHEKMKTKTRYRQKAAEEWRKSHCHSFSIFLKKQKRKKMKKKESSICVTSD